MEYIISDRDKWFMKCVAFQLYRLAVLSLKFMKLTNSGCALPPRPRQ